MYRLLIVGVLYFTGGLATGVVALETVSPKTLITAAGEGDIDSINQWLENHEILDIDAAYNGRTALMEAVKNGHEDVVRFLIDVGANFELRVTEALVDTNISGEHIRSCVAHTGNCRLMSVGLRSRTALGEAVMNGRERVVDTLLEFGADPNAEIVEGKVYIDNWLQHKERLLEMVEHENHKDSGYVMSVLTGITDESDDNCCENSSFSLWKNDIETVLMKAVDEGNGYIASVLLNANANPNIRAREVWISDITLMEEMKTRRTCDCYRDIANDFLYDEGIVFNTWDALANAVYNGRDEIVDMMIAHDADVNVNHYFPLNKRHKVLDLARERGHGGIEGVLVRAGAKTADCSGRFSFMWPSCRS